MESTRSGYQVYACEGCEAYWLDRESRQETLSRGEEQLYQNALKNESKAPIKRGQRMCPTCQNLLRSPADPSEPESCGTCGGKLYCS